MTRIERAIKIEDINRRADQLANKVRWLLREVKDDPRNHLSLCQCGSGLLTRHGHCGMCVKFYA